MTFECAVYADKCILKVVLEQLNRPEERRCPVAKASNEVVELLCEHWEIFAPGCMWHFISDIRILCDLTASCNLRFNVNDIPAIFLELLQSS